MFKNNDEVLFTDDNNDEVLFADDNDDEVLFADDNKIIINKDIKSNDKWKILIVDDEESIHSVTKLALKNFIYNDKRIEFISAYSGKEAIKIIKNNNDIAVILLDVVMETDDAGLIVVNTIRNELKNKNIRIILRTGQPGQAPEKFVINNYDINDYKEKTELTTSKLYIVIRTALKTYEHIQLLFVACGGGGSSPTDETQTEQSTDETNTTTTTDETQSNITDTTLSNESLTPPIIPTL